MRITSTLVATMAFCAFGVSVSTVPAGAQQAAAETVKKCDYRFESQNQSHASTPSGNIELFYSAKMGCKVRAPRLVQFVIEDSGPRLATVDSEKLLRNFTSAEPSSTDDGRVYFKFHIAFAANGTGRERSGVISWEDPALRRIDLHQGR